MRARYYNVDIKRFINQDVLTGAITNPKSLNRFSYVQGNPISLIDPFGLSPTPTDRDNDPDNPRDPDDGERARKYISRVHTVLDVLGLIPVYGIAPDLVNCIFYIIDGDKFNAVLSGISAVPGIGETLGATKVGIKAAKFAFKLAKSSDIVGAIGKLMSNAAGFTSKAGRAFKNAGGEIKKLASKIIKGGKIEKTGNAIRTAVKNSKPGKLMSSALEGVKNSKVGKWVSKKTGRAKNYKYSQSVIDKSKDLYHDFPKQLDDFILENPVVTRPDGRIEFLTHGGVNGVDGVYHITTKDDLIIHRTFIPSSDWERFSSVNGLPTLSNIPSLK